LDEQPSPFVVLPSSHCSPGPGTPSPQICATPRHEAPSTKLRIVLLTVSPKMRSTFDSRRSAGGSSS
jgi:hypothetical protein